MSITQTISAVSPAGVRGVDLRDIFVTKQEAFQDNLVTNLVPELNVLIGQMNTASTTINGYATTATTQAGVATTQAGVSTAQAVISTAQAVISTAQAGIATTKANEILGYVIPTTATYAYADLYTNVETDALIVTAKDDVTKLDPVIDFSRAESYVKADGSRWLKNYGKGSSDGEMLSGQMLKAHSGGITPTTFSSDLSSMSASASFIVPDTSTRTIIYSNNWSRAYTTAGKLYVKQASGAYIVSNANIVVGEHYRIHIVYAGTSLNIYINGVLDSSSSVTAYSGSGIPLTIIGYNIALGQGNTVSNVSIIDTAITATDILYDYNNPEDIIGVATNTNISPFSFDTNDILACFPLNEGTMGGGSVWDIKRGTSYPISNYATTMWTDADNLAYGLQQTLLVKDDINNFATGIAKNSVSDLTNIGATTSTYYTATVGTISAITTNGFTISATAQAPTINSVYNGEVLTQGFYKLTYSYVVNSGTCEVDTTYIPTNVSSTTNYSLVGSGTKTFLINSAGKTLDASEPFLTFVSGTFNVTFSNIQIEKVEYSKTPKLQLGYSGQIKTLEKSLEAGVLRSNTVSMVLNREDFSVTTANGYITIFQPIRMMVNSANNNIYFYLYNNTITGLVTSDSEVHITVVQKRLKTLESEFSIYISGELVYVKVIAYTSDITAYVDFGTVSVGSHSISHKVSHLETFDRALTEFEVLDKYNQIKATRTELV